VGIIYKPQTRKGPVFLSDIEGSPPTITLADGRTFTAVRGDRAGGVYKGHDGYQWVFPKDVLGQEGAKLTFNGKTQDLKNTNMSYRGDAIGSLSESSKGAIGSPMEANVPGGFAPGTVGSTGVAPAFIGDQFPKAVTTNYDPITGAAPTYQYIDPIKFGQQYNPFQLGEIKKNAAFSKELALDAVDTELQALTKYVPQSAAIKREQTAQDNTFNQAERTRQVNTAVPDVVKDINQQAEDARAYARGEVPNDVVDRALELGVRSAAADVAATSGFGVRSSAARKTSDLMSAEKRIGLSQYGNQLLSSNMQARQELFLAPTSYSNAGQQVNVMPSLSGSQLQQQNLSETNQNVLVQGTTAFQNATQQSQFISNLIQQTQQFNATNTLQNDQYNATNLNNFALSYFNYLNSYVNSLAGAMQTSVNTDLAISQQGAARDEANKQKKKTQDANALQGALQFGGQIIGAFSDSRLKENVIDYMSGLDDLLKLDVIKYVYKKGSVADDGGRPHVGVSAQQLQTIFPSSVGKHSSGYLQIDPSEIIYALVSAVKELSARCASLESKQAE